MKTFEVYIDRTETLLVQALDEDAAKDHAMGGEPDAPGCVLESFGTETNDVRAVEVDAPKAPAPYRSRELPLSPGPFAQGIAHP
jgi:hypothetical protein